MMQERGRWQTTRCHWHVGTVRNSKAELNQDGAHFKSDFAATGSDLGPLSLPFNSIRANSSQSVCRFPVCP
jgi:hypothetical protein